MEWPSHCFLVVEVVVTRGLPLAPQLGRKSSPTMAMTSQHSFPKNILSQRVHQFLPSTQGGVAP